MWVMSGSLLPTSCPEKGPQTSHLWRPYWLPHISDLFVANANPGGTITNSDLDLTCGLIHLEALEQTFGIRECTILRKTDNPNTLFWQ